MIKRHSSLLALFSLLMILVHAPLALAEGDDDGNVFANQKIGIPVYDPEAKRYFAFMKADARNYGTMWNHVTEQAQAQVFKGVRGRLAIVDTAEVHSFLLRTFKPNHYQYVWIGLRYLCNSKQLQWSDGKLWKPGSFQFWDAKWNQDVYTCANKNDPNDWAPVAYSPSMQSWIVKGNTKGYEWYFIEYPTGHE